MIWIILGAFLALSTGVEATCSASPSGGVISDCGRPDFGALGSCRFFASSFDATNGLFGFGEACSPDCRPDSGLEWSLPRPALSDKIAEFQAWLTSPQLDGARASSFHLSGTSDIVIHCPPGSQSSYRRYTVAGQGAAVNIAWTGDDFCAPTLHFVGGPLTVLGMFEPRDDYPPGSPGKPCKESQYFPSTCDYPFSSTLFIAETESIIFEGEDTTIWGDWLSTRDVTISDAGVVGATINGRIWTTQSIVYVNDPAVVGHAGQHCPGFSESMDIPFHLSDVIPGSCDGVPATAACSGSGSGFFWTIGGEGANCDSASFVTQPRVFCGNPPPVQSSTGPFDSDSTGGTSSSGPGYEEPPPPASGLKCVLSPDLASACGPEMLPDTMCLFPCTGSEGALFSRPLVCEQVSDTVSILRMGDCQLTSQLCPDFSL